MRVVAESQPISKSSYLFRHFLAGYARTFGWRFLAAIAIFSCFVAFRLSAAEPEYQGKSADYWLNHFFTEPNGIMETVSAFKAMGSNSVPFLIEVLERKPSAIGEVVDTALYKEGMAHRVPQTVIKTLPSAMQTQDRREHAAFLLEQIGPDAEPAIPALMTVLTNQSEGWRLVADCRGALIAMGEKLAAQVPTFIGFLKSGDRHSQQLGAVLLASTGPKAHEAVPELLALSEDPDGWVSLSAAEALWKIDQQTNAALRVFTNCLNSSNSSFQHLALVHLRDLGTAAEPAGPAVQRFLTDPDTVLRGEAETTLKVIAPQNLRQTTEQLNRDALAQLNKLIQMLKTGTFQERSRALETIPVLGPDAAPAVAALIDVLNGPAPDLPGTFSLVGLMNSRRYAAQALAEIGPDARAALPDIIRLLNERKDNNPAIYCRALGCIGQKTKEAVSALESALHDENRGVRLAAADALTRIAPDQCTNAVRILRELQTDPELATVWIVNSGGIAEPTAKKDFNNPTSRFFRLAASVPLWRLGLEKEPPVAAILEAIKERGCPNEFSYIEMLGDIGPEAKAALSRLEASLGQHGRAVAIAIRKIDPSESARLRLPGVLLVP